MEKMENQLTITEKLIEVQSKLKAPKNQSNDFAHFKYRSCEDILEAVKPLLKEQGLSLIINDDIALIGDRYYVKATVLLSDGVTSISNTAFAREDISKKGMDASQVTGATSSYARKYALNGLFLIDDNKDADSNEHKLMEDNAKKKQQEEEISDFNKFIIEVNNSKSVNELNKIGLAYNYLKRKDSNKWRNALNEKAKLLKQNNNE